MPVRKPRSELTLIRQRALGTKLAQARNAAHLTIRDVGALMKFSPTWVSKIEKGQTAISAIDLQRLADLYEYPVAWFTDSDFETNHILRPKHRADWELLFPGEAERARMHADLDRVFAASQASTAT